MNRIWQWTWDRYATRYSWAVYAVSFPMAVLINLFWSFLIVAVEDFNHYVEAAAVAVVAVPVLAYVGMRPGRNEIRLAEQWAAGHEIDRVEALEGTYAFGRGVVARAVVVSAVGIALLSVIVGAIAGASSSRLGRV